MTKQPSPAEQVLRTLKCGHCGAQPAERRWLAEAPVTDPQLPKSEQVPE